MATGPASYDSLQAMNPSVLVENGTYRMWYGGCDPVYDCSIVLATSADGMHWTKHGVVLAPIGGNESIVGYPSVVKVGGTYWMYYSAIGGPSQAFAATSPNGISWTRRGLVLSNGSVGSPDAAGVVAPRVLFEGGTYRMWYTGSTGSGPSDIMLADSTDGLNWTKEGLAVTPGPAGSLDSYAVQYASVVHIGPAYIMAYAGLTDPFTSSILYANSSNGVTWNKAGQLLAGIPGNETNLFQPDVAILPNGQWNLYYSVRNDGNDLAIYLAVSDVMPPVTVATVTGTPGGDGWLVSDATVTLNATDDASGIAGTSYSLDQGPWTLYTMPIPVDGDGVHTLRYNSTDRAGNAESTRTTQIRIDTTPPTTTDAIIGPAGTDGWYRGSVTLTLAATDAASGVARTEFSLNGLIWQKYTLPLSFSEGVTPVLFQSTDAAGNVESPRIVLVKIDATVPTATLTVPSQSTQSRVNIAWTVSDSGSGVGHVELSVDGGTPADATNMTSTVLVLGDGPHTITLRVTDRAGNTVSAQAFISVDSNIFSPSGPYSGAPTYLLIALAVAVVTVLLWRRRRKPTPMAPQPTPPTQESPKGP